MYDVDVDINVAGLSNYRSFDCIFSGGQEDIQDVQCHATCAPPNAYNVNLRGIYSSYYSYGVLIRNCHVSLSAATVSAEDQWLLV